MGRIGAPEIIIIVLIIVLLFGAKKLPDLARSLGRSMRIIKSEVNEMNNDSVRPSSDLEQNQLPQGQQQYQQTAQQNFTQPPQAQQLPGRRLRPGAAAAEPERLKLARFRLAA